MKIELVCESRMDRDNLVSILAHNGYYVKVKFDEDKSIPYQTKLIPKVEISDCLSDEKIDNSVILQNNTKISEQNNVKDYFKGRTIEELTELQLKRYSILRDNLDNVTNSDLKKFIVFDSKAEQECLDSFEWDKTTEIAYKLGYTYRDEIITKDMLIKDAIRLINEVMTKNLTSMQMGRLICTKELFDDNDYRLHLNFFIEHSEGESWN